ncbi:MAG TPA: hypothetical protein VGW39_11430 [Chthoniobacterales bacterium]|nr:hypothetical protein [Chthoniobacterales bacterium]
MRTSQKLSFLAVALLLPCLFASAKHGDVKNASRPISGVTSTFQLLNAVIRSGEPINIRVTLHNESASPVEFRYVNGSFIEHIRIYDTRHRQVPVRLNAPFLESGAEKVILQPGEQFTNVVNADLWQMYDLEPGTYELRFYYDLRLIADETLAAKSMKRYHSRDWILWDMKRYPLTVIDAEVSDASRNGLEHGERASTTIAFTTSEDSEVSKNVARLGATIDNFLFAWGTPSHEERLVRTASLKWNQWPASFASIVPDVFAAEVAFLDGIACEIVLRSKQRITPDEMVRLAKPILPHFRPADFAKPRSDVNGIRIYALEDGTSVSVNEHKGYFVIVIRGQCYWGNEEVFDREAAKVRPPTSNH